MAIATINGSGSATANNILLRTLFRMGIPVSGKNIFPSNIQGLPTWYTIRASADGFVGRSEVDDILVAMNPASIVDDIRRLAPDGVLFYADDITIPIDAQGHQHLPDAGQEAVAFCRCGAGAARVRGQHGLCRHPGGHPGHRPRYPQADPLGPLPRQREGRQLQLRGGGCRGRVGQGESKEDRSLPRGKDRQDRRLHHDRRQCGRCAGLHLRRRAVRRLVPDHTGFQPGGRAQREPAAPAPGSKNKEGYLRGRAGRG